MKWRFRLMPTLGILLLLSTAVSSALPPDKTEKDKPDKKPNYYPMEVGNQWTFRVEAGGNATSLVSTIAKIENIDGVPLARLEAMIDGKIVATEHMRQTDKGVFRHRNNGQEISPPICLVQYPVKSGNKWEGDMTVGIEKAKYFCEAKEETVEVAAGKFKAMRVAVRLETDDKGVKKTVHTTYWFVTDVGFVKQTVEVENLKILMELEKFDRPKAKKK